MHCSRRRFLRRGLEFHVCTINASAHTKKVWKLIVCTSSVSLFGLVSMLISNFVGYLKAKTIFVAEQHWCCSTHNWKDSEVQTLCGVLNLCRTYRQRILSHSDIIRYFFWILFANCLKLLQLILL